MKERAWDKKGNIKEKDGGRGRVHYEIVYFVLFKK